MKKYTLLVFTVILFTLSACSGDKLTGTYTTTGNCPSHLADETMKFADGKVIDNDNLESYNFTSDESLEFYPPDEEEAYVGTFRYFEEDNGFTLDHDNGNYTCTFTN